MKEHEGGSDSRLSMEQGVRRGRSAKAKDGSHIIVTAALNVHSALGPGLLESAYETCLMRELAKSGLKVSSQVGLPLMDDGLKLDIGYRLDLLVENS